MFTFFRHHWNTFFRHHWKWFVWGKHPSMEDFIWAGAQTPLFQGFSRWVDKGFAQIREDSTLRSTNCSWRFWTRGTGPDVVCGLLRNSCDTLGRNFPLLYIGTGGLEAWTKNSAMLPYAFESVWKNVEYVASARFDNVRHLTDSLSLIEQPKPMWQQYQHRVYNTSIDARPVEWTEFVEDGKKVLRFKCRQPEHLPLESIFCERVTPADQAPIAVFIGEIQGDIAVAVIQSALKPEDFVWLWSLNREPLLAETIKN